jgi:hypothetical protein
MGGHCPPIPLNCIASNSCFYCSLLTAYYPPNSISTKASLWGARILSFLMITAR